MNEIQPNPEQKQQKNSSNKGIHRFKCSPWYIVYGERLELILTWKTAGNK